METKFGTNNPPPVVFPLSLFSRKFFCPPSQFFPRQNLTSHLRFTGTSSDRRQMSSDLRSLMVRRPFFELEACPTTILPLLYCLRFPHNFTFIVSRLAIDVFFFIGWDAFTGHATARVLLPSRLSTKEVTANLGESREPLRPYLCDFFSEGAPARCS